MWQVTLANPEGGGGRGGEDRGSKLFLKNDKIKNIEFLSKTGQDRLKNHKATKTVFNFGPSLLASQTPFKWHFAGGLMMARLYWHFDPPSLQ